MENIKENEKENKVVCVLGMHRSGTSLVTHLLNICGVYLGDEKELLSGCLDNKKGHWENREIMQINDKILQIFEGSWDKPPIFPKNWENDERLDELYKKAQALIDKMNQESNVWGFKDPRTCLTLPFWQKIIPDMKYIILIRNPKEVADSLYKRNGINISDGLLLYLSYWNSILKYTNKENRCFALFDNYFSDWETELKKILDCAGLEFDFKDKEKIEEFISPSLRHNKIIEKKKILI